MRNYLTERDQERNATAPWKIPRKIKKQGRKKVLERFFESCNPRMDPCHVRRCIKLHWAPLVGWTITANSIWNENRVRRKSKAKLIYSPWRGYDFDADCNSNFEEACNDFDADYDDFDNWGDDWERHGYDCDCDECTNERDMEDCGELPPHLGGGCSNAGSEYCDFECPFRDRVMNGEDDDE